MTSKEVAKQGFELAQKEAHEKQVQEVKRIVTKTLEKIEKLRTQIRDLQKQERILKLDLEDLKEGKLDQIAERQEVDKEAKSTSVVVIIKDREVVREQNPWYWPYRITWSQPSYPIYDTVYCQTTEATPIFTATTTAGSTLCSGGTATINCSVAKSSAAGTYEIDGKVVHFR